MELIDFVRENGLQALTDQLAIAVKRHSVYQNLVLMKYNQIESPMANKIVQQCRGIILDEADDWRIVSYGLKKFFNHGEGHAAAIDWPTARIYDKLDGSLIYVWWYNDQWHMQTSGTPDGETPVGNWGFTFRQLFWDTWHDLKYDEPPNTDVCYGFELMTGYNEVVVKHKTHRIVLHSARNLRTLQELDPYEVVKKLNWEVVRAFPLNSLNSVIEAARELDPMNQEGFVVVDANFNRVKIKSPQYVILHHYKSAMGFKQLLELVRTNESDEFLSYFPEWEKEYNIIKSRYEALCEHITSTYEQHKHILVQKDFALEVIKYPFSSILFTLRTGKFKTVKECLFNTQLKKIAELLNINNTLLEQTALVGE